MSAIAATTLVCLRCRSAFFAEYGVAGGTFCCEECEHTPVADPDDDDGFDGLPFDPESGEHHCVFVRPGCDVSELPREWQDEAQIVLDGYVSRGFGFGRCVCDRSHTVLGRDDVRRLRAAGFVVEAVGDGDCSEFRTSDYDDCGCRDYDDYDGYSAAAYLRGDFDGEDRGSRDLSVESYYHESDLWSIGDELEVIEELGYIEPMGVREILDGDAPVRQSERPIVLAPERYVVGVFEITRSRNPFRWQLRHCFGGLAPCMNGEYAKVAEYMSRDYAMDSARDEMERLGLPVAA